MLKETKIKIRYFISLRAIKIVGLILLVAAQAFPLRAFESHIVSVTAIIEPPATTAGPESLNLATVEGAQTFVVEPLSLAADPAAGAPGPELTDGAQADSGESAMTALSDATMTQNDNNGNNQGDSSGSPSPSASPSPEANTGSDAPSSSETLTETQTVKIEISSAEEQLTIENVTPFEDSSGAMADSQPAVSVDSASGGTDVVAGQ